MTSSIVDEKRLEGAMLFLAESDEPSAEQKAAVIRAEILCKRTRSRIFLTATGNNEERKAQAEVHGETCIADDVYLAAFKAHETTKARRENADLVVRVYQTLSANRRLAGG